MANKNKNKKYHFLYKTTNLLTNKYYVGVHSTSNLKDGYLGSGKRLRYSIRKYGKENFQIEILEFFDSREALMIKERSLVNESLLQDPMCMNLRLGGDGGFLPEHQKLGSLVGNQQLQKKLKDPDFYVKWKHSMSEGLKKAYKEGRREKKFGGWNKGKSLNEDHKKKIGLANSVKQKGSKNSQFGIKFKWINDGFRNAKLVDEKIPEGWKLGKLPIKVK
jgi:hypothetical protein